MGFKPKSPAPPPVPTADPLVVQAQTTDEVDAIKKKREALKAGKSALTVELAKPAGLNVGGSSGTGAGLSVGGK